MATLNSRATATIATCIALNVGLGKVANLLAIPITFDTIGTILSAVLLPWPAALAVGAASSLLAAAVINPVFAAYIGTQIAIALSAAFLARHRMFDTRGRSLFSGVLVGLVSAVASAPVTAIVFGGVAVPSITALNVLLLASGKGLWQSVLTGALVVETIDKSIASLISHEIKNRVVTAFVPPPTRSRI